MPSVAIFSSSLRSALFGADMKRLMQFLILLALLLLPIAMLGAPVQCTGTGWYQRNLDLNWNFAIPGNLTGHRFQGGGAHTLAIYDGDGAQYAIIDQCPVCTGTTGTYSRPDHPGVALSLWETYYIGPDAADTRNAYGYNNASFSVPGGQAHYTFVPLSQVPEPKRTSLAAAYGCSGSVTPPPVVVSSTRTAAPPGTTRTATRQPTSAGGCCVEGIDCLPGSPVVRCTPTGSIPPTRTRTVTPVVQRFTVTVGWTKPDGTTGHGVAVPLTSTTTAYWFFTADNLELMLKLLDGCATNGHRWVFIGGLTNVAVSIAVKDNQSGITKSYQNPQGTLFQPVADTAFGVCQ